MKSLSSTMEKLFEEMVLLMEPKPKFALYMVDQPFAILVPEKIPEVFSMVVTYKFWTAI
ncbi:hypothetical protein J2S74_000960 [Evansella vedderi]|uniref:Uncharacterized protein n=1 Tax=Evansella vedderi TaxID=38282 RepID=A0ABT9ZQS9_9BACI|nr:hypothetical protein [Evansella vedderi]